MNKLPLPQNDKSLGQHFLKDQNVITKICHDFFEDTKNNAGAILEIGPGPGILTETLASFSLPFKVIELDQRFKVYLEQFIPSSQIILGDALKLPLADILSESFFNKPIWLVSNLPYNVSAPLLVLFLQISQIKQMTLMFQKEVADKVYAFHTTKNSMNSLMALTQTYFECRLLLKVSPGAFTPPPKVDSAVLSMKRIENPIISLEEFHRYEKFLRLLFSHRRKQLGGVLRSSFPESKIKSIFEHLNISISIRAEALTLTEVHELYRNFHP